MPIGRSNPATASTRATRSPSFFAAQSYLSSVLASLWGSTRCARVGLRVDWSLATSAYYNIAARCAVGLRGCGYRPPWLWPPRHRHRCSIRVGCRQVFPELQHSLDRRTCSADICIFLECVAARPPSRLCRLRAGRKPRETFASKLRKGVKIQ